MINGRGSVDGTTPSNGLSGSMAQATGISDDVIVRVVVAGKGRITL